MDWFLLVERIIKQNWLPQSQDCEMEDFSCVQEGTLHIFSAWNFVAGRELRNLSFYPLFRFSRVAPRSLELHLPQEPTTCCALCSRVLGKPRLIGHSPSSQGAHNLIEESRWRGNRCTKSYGYNKTQLGAMHGMASWERMAIGPSYRREWCNRLCDPQTNGEMRRASRERTEPT